MKHVPAALVTEKILDYFERLGQLQSAPSKTGDFLESARLNTHNTGCGPRNPVENRLEEFLDAARPLRDCDSRDLSVLKAKLWSKRGNLIVSRRHKSGALVPFTKAISPSDTACAKELGFKSAKAFRSAYNKARQKVARRLAT